jgi:hypothetical protein
VQGRPKSLNTHAALPGAKSASVRPPHLRKLKSLLATPMNQPPPSGGELRSLIAIYQRIALARLNGWSRAWSFSNSFDMRERHY